MTAAPEIIISDEEIERVHANANFGPRDKRNVVNEAVLKIACGFSNGSTSNTILSEHGLVTLGPKNWCQGQLTGKGRQYLWAVFGRGIP